jgi:CheY-like chemotaxis protein
VRWCHSERGSRRSVPARAIAHLDRVESIAVIEHPGGRRRKVLIVDDQPTLARAIKRMLADHDVTTVSNARDALTRIEEGERFDVILSDLMMPELSGMDLHAAIGQIAPDQVTKMVFMTGGAFTGHAREFFEHVPNPTIEKPFDKGELMAAIEAFLR